MNSAKSETPWIERTLAIAAMGLAVSIGSYGIGQVGALAEDIRTHDKAIVGMETKQEGYDRAAEKVDKVAEDVAVIKSQVADIKEDQTEIKEDMKEIKDMLRNGVTVHNGGTN